MSGTVRPPSEMVLTWTRESDSPKMVADVITFA